MYQAIPKMGHYNCRFHPTCSQYTYEAVDRFGALKGVFMGIKRLLRCHPFCEGGYDPVAQDAALTDNATFSQRSLTTK